ncbi:MAG: hypothetical protein R3E95_12855 [Thiolinea sp.]
MLEQNQTLWKSYNIAELGDMADAADQGAGCHRAGAGQACAAGRATPPVDSSTASSSTKHTGVIRWIEMTDGELATRDVNQYLSSYRRVLDYFDAVKIGPQPLRQPNILRKSSANRFTPIPTARR